MSKTARTSSLIWLLLAFVAGVAVAQTPASPVTVRSSRPAVSVAPGSVVTMPFMIRNGSSDSVAIKQAITLPAGWTTVNSVAPSMLGAEAMELWLVSVAAPAGAPAGQYVIGAGLVAKGSTVSDTTVVTIEERYSLDVKASAAPTYVLAGDAYETTFIVRNGGNVTTRVKLKATSNRGSQPKLSATEIDLTAGATQPVKVVVSVPGAFTRSQQDLLEIIAIDAARDSVRAATSVETTIIAKGSASADYWTIPGDVSFRAATAGAGVSALVASGSGRLSENSNVAVDFNVQTKPDAQSAFGERDQYRFGLKSETMSLRAGDQSFGFSTLTSSGSQGTGGEFIGRRGAMVAGGYLQKSRWMANSGAEMAAMVGSADDQVTGGSLVLMQRNNSVGASRVLSGSARTSYRGASVDLEAAKSDSLGLGGAAGLVRVYGMAPTFAYDVGLQEASQSFAGAQRASSDQHLSLSGQKLGSATLAAMVAIHRTNPTVQSSGFGQRISTSSLTASFKNGSSVEYERFDRNDFAKASGIRGTQQSVRARGRLTMGVLDFQSTLQTGIVSQADSVAHDFVSLSGAIRARLGRDQHLSAFVDLTDGRTLGAGGIGVITGGTTAELKLGRLTALRLTTTMTAQRDRLASWVGQADFTVERNIRHAIVALRGRISESGSKTVPSQNAFYMEVRTPLKLPTSRLNVGGRARARVVDAETGTGVAGALVRMGEIAAVTDKNGIANFKGLEAGEYHAVIEGGVTAGQLVEGGNVNVTSGVAPAEFRLNVTRGARVRASLRRMERTSVGGPAPTPGTPNPSSLDSLVDVGAVQGAVLALITSRDTIWQSADDRGRVDFGSIVPGRYTVKVVAGDIPEFTAFDKKEVEILVAAGETRDIELRLLPQVRAVQFIGEETVLIAAPKASPTTRQSPNAAPRQKNNQKQKD